MLHGIDTTFLVQVEVREIPGHEEARGWLNEALARHPQPLALAPQVLTEFVHVVTDPRRFASPLSMEEALEKAQGWWEASEVKPVYPSLDSTRLGLLWLRQHRLGRKRLLDTQLAATYYAVGVTRLLTSNIRDFEIFGVFRSAIRF
jgi:predicted nucleic acid-binding protein